MVFHLHRALLDQRLHPLLRRRERRPLQPGAVDQRLQGKEARPAPPGQHMNRHVFMAERDRRSQAGWVPGQHWDHMS